MKLSNITDTGAILGGGVIASAILKWWLSNMLSEDVTWPIYIVIHSAHAVVFFISVVPC